MSQIQGKDSILELSTDGITYKAVVCETSHTLNRERSTNSVETKCYGGIALVSVGALSGSIDFEGVFETAPSGTQVSSNEIFSYIENATYLYWREQNPTGTGTYRYRQGRGYITNQGEVSNIGDLLTFSFTLTIDGQIDVTP